MLTVWPVHPGSVNLLGAAHTHIIFSSLLYSGLGTGSYAVLNAGKEVKKDMPAVVC